MKAAGGVVPFKRRSDDIVGAHLQTFDELDFDVFSHQQRGRLSESHAADIVVTWPDGHETKGLAKHIEDLKAMFVYAPDTRIEDHPIRFGRDDWTCVTGVMSGTFSRPSRSVKAGRSLRPGSNSSSAW